MGVSLNRVDGEFEGRRFSLWADPNPLSGVEILSVDGVEVSRKRSGCFSTHHELSVPSLGITGAVFRGFPRMQLELYRDANRVARFGNPWAVVLWLCVIIIFPAAVLAVLLAVRSLL